MSHLSQEMIVPHLLQQNGAPVPKADSSYFLQQNGALPIVPLQQQTKITPIFPLVNCPDLFKQNALCTLEMPNWRRKMWPAFPSAHFPRQIAPLSALENIKRS
jgi:hypothetical protein